MTVIVQSFVAPLPETADEAIAQHLQKLLGTLTFENFAPTQDGKISIYDTVFYYRVGLFLAVPTEAIISAGQFVKMHQIKEKAKWWVGLKVLDPERPEDCLYEYHDSSKHWQPPVVMAAGMQQTTLFAQQTLLGQHGIAGIGQGLANRLAPWGNPIPLANQGPLTTQQVAAQQQVLQQAPSPSPGIWGKIFGHPIP